MHRASHAIILINVSCYYIKKVLEAQNTSHPVEMGLDCLHVQIPVWLPGMGGDLERRNGKVPPGGVRDNICQVLERKPIGRHKLVMPERSRASRSHMRAAHPAWILSNK